MADNTASRTSASPEAANTILGAEGGWCATPGDATEGTLNLTGMGGKYVKVYCETVDYYIVFSQLSVTGAVINTSSAPSKTQYVPDRVGNGAQGAPMVVPKGKEMLHYKAVSATAGVIRVIPQ